MKARRIQRHNLALNHKERFEVKKGIINEVAALVFSYLVEKKMPTKTKYPGRAQAAHRVLWKDGTATLQAKPDCT